MIRLSPRLTGTFIVWLLAMAAFLNGGAAQVFPNEVGIVVPPSSDGGNLPKLQLERELRVAPETGGRWAHTFGVTWSSDSTELAAYSVWSDLITVWNVEGTVLKEIPREGDHFTGTALAFVGGNSQLAARPVSYKDGDDAVDIYDIASGKVVHSLPGPGRPDQGSAVNWAWVLASSPDQSLLAVVYGRAAYHPVALYDTSDWQKKAEIRAPREIPAYNAQALAFSADGRFLAIALPRDVQIFDTKTHQITQTVHAYTSEERDCCINAVAFNPDASEVAVPAPLRNDTPIRVFRVADGTRIAGYPGQVQKNVWDMQWSPDGRFIAFTASSGLGLWNSPRLHLWSPSHPQERRAISVHADVGHLAFAPNGRYLAVNDGSYVTIFRIAD